MSEREDLGPRLTNSKFRLGPGSPESLFKARVSENPRRLDVNGSEASQDAFFRAYAGNLAAFTDQHYPLAAKVRKPLDDAFASVFEFISAVNGTNGGHYAARLPARVEWQIYSGFGSNFQTAPGRYSIDDLKTVAHIHQRAYGHDLFGPDNPDPFATHFEAGIKTLQGAEALMTEDAVIYFRAQMMAMFGEFLG